MQIQIPHVQNDSCIYFPCWNNGWRHKWYKLRDTKKKFSKKEKKNLLHSRFHICNTSLIKTVYGWLGISPLLPRIIHSLWAASKKDTIICKWLLVRLSITLVRIRMFLITKRLKYGCFNHFKHFSITSPDTTQDLYFLTHITQKNITENNR